MPDDPIIEHPLVASERETFKKQKGKLREKRKKAKLSPSKQKYVKALAIPGVGKIKAARIAGLTAIPTGKKIEAAIDKEIKKQLKDTKLTAEDVLLEVRRGAMFDIGNLYNEDGTFKQVYELDEDTRRAIVGLEVSDIFEYDGEKREHVGYLKKFKTDKAHALEMLMKHFGKLSGEGAGNRDRLREVIAALREPE